MCGIAGYFGSAELPPQRVQECLTLMSRRGPDHAAFRRWTNGAGHNAYLLHSRLSIIDLDPRSNQPMTDGARSIVFNGELYNYLEVRKELEAAGRRFRTSSDTEVLLAALGEHEWEVLDRCEGMWAFAVYDEAKGSLTLCRDRFGEKPLYLYRDDTGIYFGSEIKFIAALRGSGFSVNRDHICRYLVNGYKALFKGRDTFFTGLEELPAGTRLTIGESGAETQNRYWSPQYVQDDGMSYEAAVDGARSRLLRALEIRLRADVPLAFCLSGGIDSNCLISIAKRVFDYDVHGFTIINSDSRYEEQSMIDCAVQELGIRHTAIPAQPAPFIPMLRTMVRQYDGPVGTISHFAHWVLMEAVAEHGYRIAIAGAAADEIFTGYYDHHLAYLHAVRDLPQVHGPARAAWQASIGSIVRNPFLQDPDAYTKNPGMREHIFLRSDEFAQWLSPPWREPFAEERYTDDLLRNRMLNEMFHEAVPVMLHDQDLNAMYFSIENRTPFLDRELFEFCQRIPSRHLIRDARAKVVLRDAMRGIVPDPILDNRRKVGFNVPIFSYLDIQDPEVRRELLQDSPVYDYVRRDKLEELVSTDQLLNSESKFLFQFLNAKLFLEQHA